MTVDENRDIAGNSRLGLTIGAELRLRREERNQTVRDVADIVRIQTRYLEALEEDRIDHLPGRVYALGFVRTYAEYLGLDPTDMVERFKQEAKGLQPKSDLTLPEPVDEGKVPTAAIIIVAILLAGAAYSAWYFMSAPESRVVDIVPDVPEHLAGLATETPPVEETTAPVLADGPAEPPVPAPVEEAPETGRPDVPVAPPQGPPARETPPLAAPTSRTTTAAVEPPTPPTARATPPLAAPAPAVDTPPPVPAPQPQLSQPGLSVDSAATAVAPPPDPVPTVTRNPVVYGDRNVDVRIVITALEDAWLEVTDADGAILFSRVLRKGDRYRAPEQPGATFVTGNAGGLVIEVDGDPAPALGPAGVVRKNVKLDPDLLKAGQALP